MTRENNEALKSIITDLYINQHLTQSEVGKVLGGLSRARVCQMIKDFGIDTTKAEKFGITCPYCNTVFPTTRARWRNVVYRFCTTACYHAFRKSGASLEKPTGTKQTVKMLIETSFGRSLTPEETENLDKIWEIERRTQ